MMSLTYEQLKKDHYDLGGQGVRATNMLHAKFKDFRAVGNDVYKAIDYTLCYMKKHGHPYVWNCIEDALKEEWEADIDMFDELFQKDFPQLLRIMYGDPTFAKKAIARILA